MGLLVKCANCAAEALFEYQLTQETSIFYCGRHLPKFLESRKRAGLLKITDKFAEAKKEVEEILAVSIPAPEVTETPKPKKKATKKKAE
jgi:hypothetical protein